MIAVTDAIRRLARYRSPVLVFGERGTEHEEVAHALHDLGRPDGPFVACAATALTAAELRAHQTAAAGGTLFLDDVTVLAADVAAALPAVLQSALAHSDGRGAPRVVAGCPSAEPPSAEPGDPRSDLYRHLARARLRLSPLRQRRGDAVLIARKLAAGIGRDRGRDLSIARAVEDVLLAYQWPGNLDELKTVVVTAAMAANGPAIELHDLPVPLADQIESSGQPVSTRSLRDLEVQHLRQVIAETHGNKSRAARILGLSRWALQRKLRKHDITPETPDD
jgi:DNA-binding NtrC family response regulator